MKLLFMRSLAWTITVEKLDHPRHFQALHAAVRSQLELLIDMILLYNDPTNNSHEQMVAWERGQKLRYVRNLERFCESNGIDFGAEHTAEKGFLTREAEDIDRLVERFFGKRPPDRWSKQNLGEDAKKADGLTHGVWQLEKFYRTEYAQLCWNVHGSGLIMARKMPIEMAATLCAIAYNNVLNFGMHIAELMLRKMRYFDVPEAKESFENRKLEYIALCTGRDLAAHFGREVAR